MSSEHKPLSERLVQAYDNMMEHVHAMVEQAGENAEDLQHYITRARDKMVEMDELSREEADEISEYLKRDLRNIGEYREATGKDLADWFHMDMELIEWSLADMFLHVADRTKLDLLLLEENAKHVNEYHTGEITNAGTLVCTSCGEALHFKKTGHIPPCPKCKATEFERRSR